MNGPSEPGSRTTKPLDSSPEPSPAREAEILSLLTLALAPGLGPVLIARLLGRFGSAARAAEATEAGLALVEGIGPKTSSKVRSGIREARRRAEREMERADESGSTLIGLNDPSYPPLLREIDGAPPVLFVRGALEADGRDRFPVAMVGSRRCSAYGIEQAERFAGVLARSGLTVVSGGARGIDSAAHRAALESGGRTIAVVGCGLGRVYPPENAALFDRIADSGGAVVSELPHDTPPHAENFPARNRLITGLSLGVLVVEAGLKSGALITARLAGEQGREVMTIPGRVDSQTCRGSNELIRDGAAPVLEPAHVLEQLEAPARHGHAGVHGARYADPASTGPDLFTGTNGLSEVQRTILEHLAEPQTLDQLVVNTGLEPGELRAQTTLLELAKRVVREGSRLRRPGR